MRRFRSESGAAAVEFALVVPILLLLVLGIIEFGRAYNIQNSLSAAAREGVRVMAISKSPTAAKAAAKQLECSIPRLPTDRSASAPYFRSCAATTCGRRNRHTDVDTGRLCDGSLSGKPHIDGQGVMRCGG
ncbi:pilus assembly protein [Rhodococcus hoagii]|nr:pilus assembly protein [Prescottella equi]